MAQTQINQNLGNLRVIDKRRVPDSPNAALSTATFAAAQSNATLDAALIAQNGTYWTQARLDATAPSDKWHALRMGSSDVAGIS